MRYIATLLILTGWVLVYQPTALAQESVSNAEVAGAEVLRSATPVVSSANERDGQWQQKAQQLIELENYSQAKTYCGRWLLSVESRYGEDGAEIAEPLNCVAQAHRELGNHARALVVYQRAIDVLESAGAGIFDYRLLKPLTGMGQALVTLDRQDEALEILTRAKDITHRNRGIFNIEQTDVVNRITAIHYDRQDFKEVLHEQRFLLQAHEELYGNTPPLLGALKRMAKWNHRAGAVSDERSNYRRAIAISEAFYGPNDIRLIAPLRDYARSYSDVPSSVRLMSGEGASALTRVIEIYQQQEFVDQLDIAQSWTELGDWLSISGRRGKASHAWRQAWNSLEGHQDAEQLRQKFFGQPVEIQYEAIPVQVRFYDAANYPKGDLAVAFELSVTDTGRVRKLRVVGDEIGSKRFAMDLGENVSKSRYRPRLVNGVPVATHNISVVKRHNFENAAYIAPSKKSVEEAKQAQATALDENENREQSEPNDTEETLIGP